MQTVEPDFMSSALAKSFKKHRMKAKRSFSKNNTIGPHKIKQLNMFFKKNKKKNRQKTTVSLTTFTAPIIQGNALNYEKKTLTCKLPSRKSTTNSQEQKIHKIMSISATNYNAGVLQKQTQRRIKLSKTLRNK